MSPHLHDVIYITRLAETGPYLATLGSADDRRAGVGSTPTAAIAALQAVRSALMTPAEAR